MSHVAYNTLFVVYHKGTFRRIGQSTYATQRAAKAALTRHLKAAVKADERHAVPAKREDFVVSTHAEWVATEPMVETYNLLDPERKPIQIRKSWKGTSSDPAMESYHTM